MPAKSNVQGGNTKHELMTDRGCGELDRFFRGPLLLPAGMPTAGTERLFLSRAGLRLLEGDRDAVIPWHRPCLHRNGHIANDREIGDRVFLGDRDID